MYIYLSLFISVIGLIVYFASANVKIMEAGRFAYFAGLLAFCINSASKLTFGG